MALEWYFAASHAAFKDNKIWTAFTIDTSNTPAFLQEDKFWYALGCAPHPDKWTTFLPGEYDKSGIATHQVSHRAYYPADSIEEHHVVISRLRKMRLNDKFSISNMFIVDARIAVIGHDIPDNQPLPRICMKEILQGKRFHRSAVDDAIHSTSTRKNECPTVMNVRATKIDIGKKTVTAHIISTAPCKSANVYSWKKIMLICDVPILFLVDEDIDCTVERVYESHLDWLTNLTYIDRETFMLQIQSYEDDTLVPNTYTQPHYDDLAVLYIVYANSEWLRYECIGPKPSEWEETTLHNNMESVYIAHAEVMESVTSMDHQTHRAWVRTYESDPFMNSFYKGILKHYLDRSLREYIREIEGSHFIDGHQQAAIFYMANQPHFSTDRSLHKLPYHLW